MTKWREWLEQAEAELDQGNNILGIEREMAIAQWAMHYGPALVEGYKLLAEALERVKHLLCNDHGVTRCFDCMASTHSEGCKVCAALAHLRGVGRD